MAFSDMSESFTFSEKVFNTAGCLTCFTLRSLFLIEYKGIVKVLCDNGPVSWECRIHRLHLCRGVRPPQRVSWIFHLTIRWRDSDNARALGNAEYPFIAIAPRFTLAWSSCT